MLKLVLSVSGDWRAYVSAITGRPLRQAWRLPARGFGAVSIWPVDRDAAIIR